MKAGEHMDISIIIPVYNAQNTIHITLESIINNQPSSTFEVLCINDGSKDDTLTVLEGFQNSYDFINVFNKENGGAASARNFGLKHAVGRYIFFMDADDYVEGNMYDEMLEYALLDDLDIVMSDYYNTEGKVVKTKIQYDSLITEKNKKEHLLSANTDITIPFTWRNGYKRSFIEKYQFQFDTLIKYCDDSLFNTECLMQADRIKHMDKAYYHYIFTCSGLQGAPKNDFLECLELLYEGKMNTYNKLQADEYKTDLYIYTLTHTIGLLFGELVRTDKAKLREQLIKLNHSRMFKESFNSGNIVIRKLKQTKAIRLFTWLTKRNMVNSQMLLIKLACKKNKLKKKVSGDHL